MSKSQEPTLDGSAGFGLTAERDRDGVHVRITGELDIYTTPQFEKMLAGIVVEPDERVLLDLDGVRFIDSSGISAIIRAQYAADRNSYRLTIRHSTRQVRRVLRLTGLLDQLTYE